MHKLWNGLQVATACAVAFSTTAHARDLGRETLAVNDGWAASGIGVTGGSLAMPDHVYTVHTRADLIAALNDGVAR
jgi:pectate lyase